MTTTINPNDLESVRQYLVLEKGLDPELLKNKLEQRIKIPDKRGNIIFKGTVEELIEETRWQLAHEVPGINIKVISQANPQEEQEDIRPD